MKKLIFITAILITSLLNAQVHKIGTVVTNKGGTGQTGASGTTNSNVKIVTLEANLYDVANIGKILEFQTDITLTANRTLATGATLLFTTGNLILNSFTLTLDENPIEFSNEYYGIEASTGLINGVGYPQKHFFISNCGAVADGVSTKVDGTIAKGSTTFTGSGFTANDVGKVITIVSAGNPPPVPYDTIVGTFQAGETITFGTSLSTATIDVITQGATTGTFTISNLVGIIPAIGETITGGTSGATAVVRYTMQWQGQALVTTIAGYTNSTTITIGTAAIIEATNVSYKYGTDNFRAVDNATRLRNMRTGDIEVNKNPLPFLTSVVLTNTNIKTRPTGWCLGDFMDGIKIIFSGTIELFHHNIVKSEVLNFWMTEDSGWIGNGGALIGDYETFDSEVGRNEANHGLIIHSLANNGIGKNLLIKGFYGDGLYAKADTQFTNTLSGANTITGATDSLVSVGNILDNGTTDGDSNFAYNTTLFPINNFRWDNITVRGLQRWVHLTTSSFGGWNGLVNPYFWICFYNDAGDFLYKSPKLTVFTRVYIPEEEYTQARVVFYNPDSFGGVTADINLNLRPDLTSSGWDISGNTFQNCGRQGISNGPINTDIHHNIFKNIGGLIAGPAAGIDYEDGGRLKQNVRIYNNEFKDCWIGITVPNAENFWIYNNTVGPNTKDLSKAPTGTWQTGIYSFGARNCFIYGNITYNVANTIGRQDHWFNNKQYGGTLSYTANGNIVENNEFWDMSFTHTLNESTDRKGHPTIIRNNVIRITQKYEDYFLTDSNQAAIWENNQFLYNDVGNWEFEKESTDNNIFIGDNTNENRISNRGSQTINLGGYWKNNIMKGARPVRATRDYFDGYTSFEVGDYTGDEFHLNMVFKQGLAKDFTLKDFKVFGWVQFDLSQFSGTLSSPTDLTIIDSKFLIEAAEYDWTNSGSNLLTTSAKNHNLYAKNTSFVVENNFTASKFFNLAHLGTSLFEDCYFEAGQVGYIMDFTDTSDFPVSLGAVTFVDPRFGNGFNITLRAGDKILYTKPNANCNTYADNATALAVLGVGYYYKVTGTGEFKITY